MGRPCAIVAFPLLLLSLAGCARSAIVMAPDRPDRPWTPATTVDGEIVAGGQASPEQPKRAGYTLPSNRTLAGAPPPLSDTDRRHAYSLPELINIAQSNNPATRNAWDDARHAALAAGIVESTFLPRVSAAIVGGYLTARNPSTVLGQSFTTDVTAKGTVSALSLEWLLFDFGERAALVDVAKNHLRSPTLHLPPHISESSTM